MPAAIATSRKTRQQPGRAAPPREQLVLAPAERLDAILGVIRSARRELTLSMFRCDDFRVLDELAECLQRGVKVRALLTRRAKGWRKRLKQLWRFLKSMGAEVHRYGDRVVKYHAKYIVADDGPALVASLNFTRKCFTDTSDFLHITYDREVVEGLTRLYETDCDAKESSLPEGLTDRLIVGPHRARAQFTALLEQARKSIRIIDPKLTDPAIVNLLRAQKAAGLTVEVLRKAKVGNLVSHGKMMVIDDEVAVIGSISLAALAMDFRREVGLVIHDPASVRQLAGFFQEMAAQRTSLSKVFSARKRRKAPP